MPALLSKRRALLLGLLVVACASAPAPAPPPPPPPAAEPSHGPSLPKEPNVLEPLQCPPTPPMPKDASSCGDGRVGPRGYQYICAPCIPDRCCTCGYGPTSTEDCDGANLGGKSCESLGFIGGTLRCNASCGFDTSACVSVSRAGAFREQHTGGQPPRGRAHALIATGNTLRVAASDGATLRVASFDASSLAPQGELTWNVPAEYDPNRVGLDRVNHANQDTLGDVALASVGEALLVAVQRFGHSGTLLFRGDGSKLSGPISTISNARPLFFVAGKDGALLGLDQGGLALAKVGPDGSIQADAVRGLGPTRSFGSEGAAAFDGERWVVAGLAKYPNDRDARMVVSRISNTGQVLSTSFLAQPAESAAIALGGGRSVVAFATREALSTIELLPSGELGTPELFASGTFHVLAAKAGQGEVTVYASSRAGELLRLHRGHDGKVDSTPVLALPGVQLETASLSAGTLAAIYSSEDGSAGFFVAR